MSEPKCPACEIVGLNYIVSTPSDEKSGGGDAWFNIAYRSECGHVYGVFAKIIKAPTVVPLPYDPSNI